MPYALSPSHRISIKKKKTEFQSKSADNTPSIDPHSGSFDHLYSEPFSMYDGTSHHYKKKNRRIKRSFFFKKKKEDWNSCYGKKKRHKFFKFSYRKSNRRNSIPHHTFKDARDCNNPEECTKSRTFQEICQQPYQVAKEISKSIYNKLRNRYDFSLSFSTVVYSDRYFKYNLMLDSKIMPLKCYVANDLGFFVIYKKFTKTSRNFQDFFVHFNNNTPVDNVNPIAKHYMPLHTSWSIKPYSAMAGPLINFGDSNMFFHTDRRVYHSSFFEDLQKFYEINRHIDPQYKPLFDFQARSRELLDYDEFVHPYFRIIEMNRKQLQPLFHLESRCLSYRISEIGTSLYKQFSDSDMQKKLKSIKKNSIYQTMKRNSYISKFAVPDFALSEDQLLIRMKGSLYEKIRNDPEKIYDNFLKASSHISLTNLARTEEDQTIKNNDKIYTTGKKILNTDSNMSLGKLQNRKQMKNKNVAGNSQFFKEPHVDYSKPMNFDKVDDSINAILQTSSLDKNNLIVMEPLLLMKTLNEDRLKRRRFAALKAQKIMIRVIVTYTLIYFILSFITFYFLTLS